jgi:fumarate hydratase, class II
MYRIEKDSFGEIKVDSESMWGAATQRSIENFKISKEKMPIDLIYAITIIKKSASIVNCNLGKITENQKNAIVKACDEILAKKYDNQFPLSVWQTGSGTQTNMNVNEVIACIANSFLPENEKKLHQNDHINMSQSSNDVFPTAMHISALLAVEDNLLKVLEQLANTFDKLSRENEEIIKIGRTHLQDATPLSLGQEISAFSEMLKKDKKMIAKSLEGLKDLAIGGTAVGTGLNADKNFGDEVALEISKLTNKNFVYAKNKFYELTSKGEIAFVHSALKVLALDLIKIANDIRWLSSGPRCGIGEIVIPENEAGSSIMPGKVNPTQCESMIMLCYQVIANDTAISLGSFSGNFQLNVCMPLIINSFLQSVALLSDGIKSFHDNCVIGIKANTLKIKQNLENSLMLVTALNPHIGYDNAAKIAKYAYKNNTTLKVAAKDLNLLNEEDFDKFVQPEKMI